MAPLQDPLFSPAVARFLSLEGGRGADFSACVILVPHHHAAQDFRAALRLVLPAPVLLPPRLLTLPELARTVLPNLAVEPPSKRLAELHDFLRRTGHLPEAGLWQAARELGTLLEEMDLAGASLDNEAAVRALGGHASNPYLGLEAGIARAVWRALSQDAPGAARAYGQRLAHLASTAAQPLYTLGLAGLNRLEEAFLAAWALRQPVHGLPAPVPHAPRHDMLNTAWGCASPPLEQRARELAAAYPRSPFSAALAIHPAHSLEAAARVAEHILLEWLAEGRRRIALVALDRLLARRLRALLERRDILVQDETGWAFSTSAVSHVLERWLGLAGGRVWHRGLLDLLKSPFVFADEQATRPRAVHELESVLRRHGAPADLAGYRSLVRQEGLAAPLAMLQRLEAAQALFPNRRLPLADWTGRLRASLAEIGAEPGLAADPIGRQLLELLRRLERESADLPHRFSLSDWRRWLFLHLEQTTFADASVESPIRLTHLAAAHHRDLEGVLILGAGASHLPGGARATVFDDATLRQLGLPGREEKERVSRDMFVDLLCRAPTAACIWQSEADGDPAPLSPWLVHLEAFHQAAWGESLIHPLEPASAEPAGDGTQPASAPRASQVPGRLSVSAWQSLVACPYQFFARHLLGLNEQDDLPEEMDKAEYGSLVHRILARFHAGHPRLAGEAATHWVATLTTLSNQAFAVAEKRQFQATAWRQRWERHIPDYVAWALEHETAGWAFQAAETPLERAVTWGRAGRTLLYGRVDRLDRKGGETAVLDYKTQSRQTLRGKLDPAGEDVQLAAYAWLAGASAAGFVTVDEKRVSLLQAEAGPDLAARAEVEAARIAHTLEALAAGQPLPAHGAPFTCSWCEMEGLCRRAHRTA